MNIEKNQDIADILSQLYDEGYKVNAKGKGIEYDPNNPDNKKYLLLNTVSNSVIELDVDELGQVFNATLLFEGKIKTKNIEDMEKKLTTFNEKYLKDGIGSTSIRGENIEITYAVNLFGKNTSSDILRNLNKMALQKEYHDLPLDKVLQYSGFNTEKDNLMGKNTTALLAYSKIFDNLAIPILVKPTVQQFGTLKHVS